MAMATSYATTRQRLPVAAADGYFMEKLLLQLYEHYDEQDLVDVTFKLSKPTALITAHRLILSAASPYFRKLFKSEQGICPLIEIADIDSDTFERLITFCYTGKTLVTLNNVDEMLKAAMLLQLNEAVENCVHFIIENIADYTLQRARNLESETQCDILTQKILEYEIRNFLNDIESNGFLDFDAKKLQVIIESDHLCVQSERDAFVVVKRWYEHDASARKHQLPNLIACLRLTQFDADFIMTNIFTLPGCHVMALEALTWRSYPTARCKLALKYTKVRAGQTLISEELFRAFNLKSGTIFKYNKIQDLWQEWAAIKIDLSGFRAIFMNGHLIFTGGCRYSKILNEVRSWSLKTQTFQQLPTMQQPRCNHSVVILNEQVYVIGGRNKKGSLGSVERYTNCNEWKSVSNMITPRYSAGAVTFNNKIYVMGGCSENNSRFGYGDIRLKSVECYEPIMNRWTQCANMNGDHCNPGVTVHKGKIFVLGSWTSSACGTVECYDPLKNEWSYICSLTMEYGCGIGSISIGNQLWGIGGEGSNCALLYDDESNQWIAKRQIPWPGLYYCFTVSRASFTS